MSQKLYKAGSIVKQDDKGTVTLTYDGKTFHSRSVHLGKDNPGYFIAYDLKEVDTGEGGNLDFWIAAGFTYTADGNIDKAYAENDDVKPKWQASFGDQLLTAKTGHLFVKYRDSFGNASGKIEMKFLNGLTLTATFNTTNGENPTEN